MRRREFQALSSRVDTLLDEIQQGDPATAERAEELVRALMAMYAAALGRVVEVTETSPEVLRALADDEVVGDLLVLHDLHPDDTDTRIQAALDRVRPYLGSHAGGVEYHGLDKEGVAHLTLQGTCHGCPSSAVTVTSAIEQAILDASPDVVSVEVVGMVAVEPERPVLQIGLRPGLEPAATELVDEATWHELGDVPAVGDTAHTDVTGHALLVANAGGTPYAYRDSCPRCGATLAGPALEGDLLACGRCGASFDVRLAGRSADGADAHLEPVPLLPDGGGWRVSLPEQVPA